MRFGGKMIQKHLHQIEELLTAAQNLAYNLQDIACDNDHLDYRTAELVAVIEHALSALEECND